MLDRFEECCEALIAKSQERRVSLKAAQDLIDGGILQRGYYAHASKPQMVNGFMSGDGTGRRAFDCGNFMRDVEAYAAAKRKRAAA
jgi:hypothetical protein